MTHDERERGQDDNTEARVRKMFAPIEASMGSNSVRHSGAAFDSQAEKEAQKAMLEVAVTVVTALLSTAGSLRTIARSLDDRHHHDD